MKLEWDRINFFVDGRAVGYVFLWSGYRSSSSVHEIWMIRILINGEGFILPTSYPSRAEAKAALEEAFK